MSKKTTQGPIREKSQRRWNRFGVGHLLGLTTLVAVWLPFIRLRNEPERLTHEIDVMAQTLGELKVDDPSEIIATSLPKFDYEFKTWKIYIPDSSGYQVRIAVEEVCGIGFPQSFEQFPIPAGLHELSLRSTSAHDKGYLWEVFVDGQSRLKVNRSKGWFSSNGSSSNSDVSLKSKSYAADMPLLLDRTRLSLRFPTSKTSSTSLEPDRYLGAKGCCLWIDRWDRMPEPLLAWIDSSNPSMSWSEYYGLRKGIRVKKVSPSSQPIQIYHPESMARNRPTALIAMSFDGSPLATPSVQSSTNGTQAGQWKLSDVPDRFVRPKLAEEDGPRQSLFLQYEPSSKVGRIVVELIFDQSRPDELGIRLVSTESSPKIKRWTLQATSGVVQQWRRLKTNDGIVDVENLQASSDPTPLGSKVTSQVSMDQLPISSIDSLIDGQSSRVLEFRPDGKTAGALARNAIPYTYQFQGLSSHQAWLIPVESEPTINIEIANQYDSNS